MELTIEEALAKAVAAHKEGNLQEAEHLYRGILQSQPTHPEANHNMGVLATTAGQNSEAMFFFKKAVEVKPDFLQYWISYILILIELRQSEEAEKAILEARKKGLDDPSFQELNSRILRLSNSEETPKSVTKTGNADGATPSQQQLSKLLEHYQGGRFNDAEDLALSITQEFPKHPFGWKVLGALFGQSGRYVEAVKANQTAVSLSPNDAESHSNFGNTLRELGRLEEAEASYRQALVLAPDLADAHSNLGNTLKELGRLDEAEACYRQAIALAPDYAEAYNNLGNMLQELSGLEEAEACYRQAIALKADYAEAFNHLGNTLQELNRLDEAEASYRQAIALKADYAEAFYNLGTTLKEVGRLEDEEFSYLQAIALKADLVEAHNNLGGTLQELGRLDEAEASFRQAIALKPDLAEAHNNLGLTLLELNSFEEAEASYRQAIALEPTVMKYFNNLLFASNYNPQLSSAELYREYEAYNEAISALKLRQFNHQDHSPVAGRRIRIGYSSPDLRAHSCRFFIEPIFRHHDRNQFELFAYCNHERSDDHTERMKGYFDHWIDVFPMSDNAMAERIYDDQIDIMIEMAGHTKGNRLSVFAMRPAPIQVASWIGYGYTTGLKEIDYIIADENFSPAGSEAYFSEQVWRLPAPSIVYEPPRDIAPDVSDLPALRKGYVTFGSMTRLVRLNDPVFRVWKEILDRVPDSRLRLDQRPFAAESVRELFLQRLEGLGIPRDKVELTCSAPHWTGYHDIDIGLDCWPHNAGTTIFESLWMGVPVLSKTDRPSVGRWGAAILRPLGLEDWVVEDEINYIEKAVAYAEDLDALAQLRAGLRQRVDASKLSAGEVLTLNLEGAYRQMIEKMEENSL